MFSQNITSEPSTVTSVRLASTAIAACVLCAAGNAQAAQLYATDVVYHDNNNTSMSSYRMDKNNAIGSADLLSDSVNGYKGNKDFLSLGLGGRAIFDFGQDFSGDVTIWETTWGQKSKQSSYDERVDVYYGNFDREAVNWETLANDLSQWTSAGEVFNIRDNAYNTAAGATNSDFAPTGIYNHVLLVDKSQQKKGRDGFDVNAISVQGVERQEVPEPTALVGLAMMGMFGIQQRRKRQSA